MSTASTAAAVGIKIVAEDQTGKSLALTGKKLQDLKKSAERQPLGDLAKKLGYLSKSSKGLSAEFEELAFHSLGRLGSAAPRAAIGAARLSSGLALTAVAGGAAGAGILGTIEHFMTLGAEAGRMAQRLNVPVETLSRFQIAAQLTGASSEEATASLNGLQSVINSAAFGKNPQALGLMEFLHIDVGKAVKDVTAALPQIADAVQQAMKNGMPEQAQRILDLFNISRNLLFMFKDGAAGLDAYNKRAGQFGVITTENARKSQALQTAQTELGLTFQNFGRDVAGTFAPALTTVLKRFETYLLAHKDEIEDFLKRAEFWLEEMATPKNLAWLHDEFTRALGVLERIEKNPVFQYLFGEKEPPFYPGDQRHYAVPPPGTGDPSPTLGGAPGYSDTPGMILRRMMRRNGFTQHGVDGDGRRKGYPGYDPTTDPDNMPAGAAPAAAPAGGAPAGGSGGNVPWKGPNSTPVTDNARYLHDYFRSKGWDEAQVAGILGHLRGESGANFDPHAFNAGGGGQGAQGIGQWRGPRIANFRAMFGHDPREGTIQEQAQFLDWELQTTERGSTGNKLHGLHDPAAAARLMVEGYGRPNKEEIAPLEADRTVWAQQYYRQFGGQDAPAPPYAPAMAGGAPASGGTVTVNIVGSGLPPGTQIHADDGGIDPRTMTINQPVVRTAMPTPFSVSPNS